MFCQTRQQNNDLVDYYYRSKHCQSTRSYLLISYLKKYNEKIDWSQKHYETVLARFFIIINYDFLDLYWFKYSFRYLFLSNRFVNSYINFFDWLFLFSKEINN